MTKILYTQCVPYWSCHRKVESISFLQGNSKKTLLLDNHKFFTLLLLPLVLSFHNRTYRRAQCLLEVLIETQFSGEKFFSSQVFRESIFHNLTNLFLFMSYCSFNTDHLPTIKGRKSNGCIINYIIYNVIPPSYF